MHEQQVTVSNRLGLHARAAAKLVQTVQKFNANVMLVHGDREVNAKSIMGVMMLAAGIGTTLTVRCDGPDEQPAAAAVQALFDDKFGEGN